MFSRDKDHLLIGYDHDNIILIRHQNDWGFDFLPRLGYDSKKGISNANVLKRFANKTKRELLDPLRKNRWSKPKITLACSMPLKKSDVILLHQFCKLIGGVEISILRVYSMIDFLKNPHYRMIETNYLLIEQEHDYKIQEKHFFIYPAA